MLKIHQKPFIQEIKENFVLDKGLQLFIKREDLIHPKVSGNKWRKLKYNLLKAKEEGYTTLLTFGGAYSNHIYATAAAANEAGFESVGVIRGEELATKPLNHTLTFAQEQGMQLHFLSREDYRRKSEETVVKSLEDKFGRFYLLPEGGTNNLAVKGAEEIVDEEAKLFDFICLSVGTGGTVSGVIAATEKHQHTIGFSALKGDFLNDEVKTLLKGYSNKDRSNWQIENDYHFGGYAKTNDELLDFIQKFEDQYNILLDPIYTGKMMYGVYDKIKNGHFKSGSRILVIHTGGLQGRMPKG